ncbi:unnamed protein product [Staurois parvus]|uniref:Uncharacterized protein n=1 Tax=Staurois parvus TaxID=386267 RepID=A0ABN9C3B6_9NEOB|nr:unnamed protein product [Staurois parvus]
MAIQTLCQKLGSHPSSTSVRRDLKSGHMGQRVADGDEQQWEAVRGEPDTLWEPSARSMRRRYRGP